MQLVSFSVSNYRSITAAYKLPVRQSTVLIGPNNEGKSNILRSLVVALEVLQGLSGRRITSAGRLRAFRIDSGERYHWPRDFPISLQDKRPDGESIFNLEFSLTDNEVDEFAEEVKSSLNGTLPIQLTLGAQDPVFRVLKRGPGGTALSKKAEKIANFVAKRLNINYIPAVRTAQSAEEIVTRMVERQLSTIEEDPAYKAAMSQVASLQQPLLDSLSDQIRETLKEFLPKVKQVRVRIPQEARYRALRRDCEIVVDDGTPTQLSRKGDGVQSLAALSLMRQTSGSTMTGRQLILAIEEPESHLHPSAIHQLKAVLAEIARTNQVIMTTHCPLFVDRAVINSNIIVHRNRATPAKSVREIREVLGIRASDNLRHAELILVVEGEEDRRAMKVLLAEHSNTLGAALSQGTMGIESLQGGSNLSYKLSQIREALCISHSFLDHDAAGIKASEKAEKDGLLTMADLHFTVCNGLQESEIEDLYDEGLYSAMLQNKYGVSTLDPKFKGSEKWSDRLREAFKHQGKPWSDQIEMHIKLDVADLVEREPRNAINIHRKSSFDSLVASLESKLAIVAAGKK